jgi:hypothetical protein
MDNFYFIGYRFDCIPNMEWIGLSDQLKEKGFSIYHLPYKEWMTWNHSDGKHISIFR